MTLQRELVGLAAPRLSPAEYGGGTTIPSLFLGPAIHTSILGFEKRIAPKAASEATISVPLQSVDFVKPGIYTVERPPTPYPFGRHQIASAAKVPTPPPNAREDAAISLGGAFKAYYGHHHETADFAPKGKTVGDSRYPSFGGVASNARPVLVRRNAIRMSRKILEGQRI
jgi:hypothetical protein